MEEGLGCLIKAAVSENWCVLLQDVFHSGVFRRRWRILISALVCGELFKAQPPDDSLACVDVLFYSAQGTSRIRCVQMMEIGIKTVSSDVGDSRGVCMRWCSGMMRSTLCDQGVPPSVFRLSLLFTVSAFFWSKSLYVRMRYITQTRSREEDLSE